MTNAAFSQPLILASASPRRQELLQQAGIEFKVNPAEIPELNLPGETPTESVQRLAEAKARAVADCFPDRIVLGADTLVSLAGKPLGKPMDLPEARLLLQRLSARTHEVHTGVCICQKNLFCQTWLCTSRVTFKDLHPADIDRYLQLVNPLDKAGAYALQEHGEMIIAAVEGDRSNVIGLPIQQVLQKLKEIARYESSSATSI